MYGLYKAATDSRLTPVDRSILLLLFTMCGTKGYCWPSYAHIADKIGISRRYAIERMSRLIEIGYVVKGKGYVGESQEQSSNKYFINNNPE